VSINSFSRTARLGVLFPEQLRRLAELFPEGGAVGIFQDGSTITAYNGTKSVRLDALGSILDETDLETHPPC